MSKVRQGLRPEHPAMHFMPAEGERQKVGGDGTRQEKDYCPMTRQQIEAETEARIAAAKVYYAKAQALWERANCVRQIKRAREYARKANQIAPIIVRGEHRKDRDEG